MQPVILGSAQTGFTPTPDRHHTEIIFDTVRAALADAAVSIDQIDTVISASDDVMDGRSISSVFLVEAMGGFLKEESKVEEDGSLALFYAALRILSGASECALVVASSKASECDPAYYAHTTLEPFFLRPLGLDLDGCAGIQAAAYLQARGLGPDALSPVREHCLARATDNPHAVARTHDSTPVAGPLGSWDLPPHSDGCCAVVLGRDRPGVAIRGMGTASDTHRIGDRALEDAPSARQAAARAYAMAGIERPDFDVIELHAPSSAHELLLAEAHGLTDPIGPAFNPSGGALGANAIFVGGLVRVAEAARRVRDGGRALAHGHSGLFLQTNTCFVLEPRDA